MAYASEDRGQGRRAVNQIAGSWRRAEEYRGLRRAWGGCSGGAFDISSGVVISSFGLNCEGADEGPPNRGRRSGWAEELPR